MRYSEDEFVSRDVWQPRSKYKKNCDDPGKRKRNKTAKQSRDTELFHDGGKSDWKNKQTKIVA